MSMHNIPLTELERDGLEKHRLPIGSPSQLSDCFRHGIAFALNSSADWSQIGLIMEAADFARQQGFMVGTTNWASAVSNFMIKSSKKSE
jgi:hypothetical protein